MRRFFQTPKGLLTIVLVLLAGLSAPGEGVLRVAPGLVGATIGAGLLDALWLRVRNRAWEFPSGAILTGLIVAMVLSPLEPWYVTTVTAAVGVASKYLFRTRSANLFNPAAFGLVATSAVFETGQSWWGALPNLPLLAILVLFLAGVFITDRVNKMPLVLVFLGTYYLLFTGSAFLGDPAHVAEIFRAPDLHAVLFFAFFILTDPPTSPAKYPGQVICGLLVAVVSYGVFEWIGGSYYLVAGVLVGNLWEGWQRTRTRRVRVTARAPLARA